MKRKIAWLIVCTMLLLPALSLAEQAEATPKPMVAAGGRDVSLRLLESVFATDNNAEQVEMILKAAEASPNDVEILMQCAQLMNYFDMTGEHLQTSEGWLRKALSLARGEEAVLVIQMLAEQFFYQDRISEAIDLLQEAVQDMPDETALKSTLALALHFDDRSSEAMTMLEGIIEDNPKDMEALRFRANILLDQYEYDEALSAFEQIQEAFPEYLDGLYGQYLTYVASGEFEMGVRAIDILLGSGAEEQLWLERARIRLWKQYLPEEAKEEATALLRMDATWTDASVTKLAAHLMLDEYAEAYAMADAIAQQDTNFADLLRASIDTTNGDWAQAKQRMEKLVRRAPYAYGAWRMLAAIHLDGYGDVDSAMNALAEGFAAAGGMGDYDMYMLLGQLYRRQGNVLEAARAYTAANAETLEDPGALYMLVSLCLDAGHEQDARDMLTQMEKQYPGWYETMMARVVFEDATGSGENALASFEKVKEKYPLPASWDATYEALLQIVIEDETGLTTLREKAEAKDATAEDWDIYTWGLVLSGNLDAAQDALAEVEKRIPEETENNVASINNLKVSILTTKAAILTEQGDLKGAVALYTQATDLGWLPFTLLLEDDADTVRETEAFALLMERIPEIPETWDLSIPPTIPEVQNEADSH